MLPGSASARVRDRIDGCYETGAWSFDRKMDRARIDRAIIDSARIDHAIRVVDYCADNHTIKVCKIRNLDIDDDRQNNSAGSLVVD